MPTNVELYTQIDEQITDKTTAASISPTDVGENIKAAIEYTDQEIALLASEVTEQIDAAAIGIWQDAGNWDASVGTFPTLTNQGSAVDAGSIFQVSVAGTMSGTGSLAVSAGESFRALIDNPGQVANNWRKAIVIYNQATTSLAGIVELATAGEMNTGTSTSLVPPVKLVKDYVADSLSEFTPPPAASLVYKANLTQTSGGGITATELVNTLGTTIEYTVQSTGSYGITPGDFGDYSCFVSNISATKTVKATGYITAFSGLFKQFDLSGNPVSNFTDVYIEIRPLNS